MNYTMREMLPAEYPLLRTFVYESIFVHDGDKAPPRSIVDSPEFLVYTEDFGRKKDDCCVVAVAEDGTIMGAAWVRIMHDYGHVDDETPSLAIALFPAYRGCGIGTAMMEKLLELLRLRGTVAPPSLCSGRTAP